MPPRPKRPGDDCRMVDAASLRRMPAPADNAALEAKLSWSALAVKSSLVGWAIVTLLAALFLAAFLLAGQPPKSRWHEFVPLLLNLFAVCLLSIFALNFGLGTSPLWGRLLMLPSGGAVVAINWSDNPSVRQLIDCSLVVLFIALPSLAMRVFRFRIARRVAYPTPRTADRRPIQFSLRHLFELTFVVALAPSSFAIGSIRRRIRCTTHSAMQSARA